MAEDVDEIRDLVCFFLETAGYLVLPAANGQAALQVAADFGGPIDLVLTWICQVVAAWNWRRLFLKFIHE